MGLAIKLNCECGYDQRFFLGCGRLMPKYDDITALFPPTDIADFTAAFEDNTVSSFYIEEKLAYCGECGDLGTAPVLCYHTGEEVFHHFGVCGICNTVPTYLDADSENPCPSCGTLIKASQDGFWD